MGPACLRRLTSGCPARFEVKCQADLGPLTTAETAGHLRIRGPGVTAAYFKSDAAILDAEGYFDTGDIATIDREGFVRITNRAKDIIKSGGEWIRSIEVENAALSYPAVELAAVIGVPHPKWGERPRLYVQVRAGEPPTRADLLNHLAGRLARWWLPDDVTFLDAIPLGATGKVDKKALRALVFSS